MPSSTSAQLVNFLKARSNKGKSTSSRAALDTLVPRKLTNKGVQNLDKLKQIYRASVEGNVADVALPILEELYKTGKKSKSSSSTTGSKKKSKKAVSSSTPVAKKKGKMRSTTRRTVSKRSHSDTMREESSFAASDNNDASTLTPAFQSGEDIDEESNDECVGKNFALSTQADAARKLLHPSHRIQPLRGTKNHLVFHKGKLTFHVPKKERRMVQLVADGGYHVPIIHGTIVTHTAGHTYTVICNPENNLHAVMRTTFNNTARAPQINILQEYMRRPEMIRKVEEHLKTIGTVGTRSTVAKDSLDLDAMSDEEDEDNQTLSPSSNKRKRPTSNDDSESNDTAAPKKKRKRSNSFKFTEDSAKKLFKLVAEEEDNGDNVRETYRRIAKNFSRVTTCTLQGAAIRKHTLRLQKVYPDAWKDVRKSVRKQKENDQTEHNDVSEEGDQTEQETNQATSHSGAEMMTGEALPLDSLSNLQSSMVRFMANHQRLIPLALNVCGEVTAALGLYGENVPQDKLQELKQKVEEVWDKAEQTQ